MKAASVRPSIATPRVVVASLRALVSLGVVLVAVLVGCGEAPTGKVSSARMVELPARSVVYASGDSLGVAVPSGRDIEFLSESGQTVGTTPVEGDIVAVDVSTVGPRAWLEVLTCATPVWRKPPTRRVRPGDRGGGRSRRGRRGAQSRSKFRRNSQSVTVRLNSAHSCFAMWSRWKWTSSPNAARAISLASKRSIASTRVEGIRGRSAS